MSETPVFRLRIHRKYVKTTVCFRAEDPWNGDRPSDFAIEDYRLWEALNVPMPAIVSDADRVERFMPDSLCSLYQDGKVPAESLPRLLQFIGDGLVRSDFRPVLRNAVFYASYLAFAVITCVTVIGTALVLFVANTPSLRSVLGTCSLIGVCWLWWHFGYRRKLKRRKQQKKRLLAMITVERTAQPPTEEPAPAVEKKGVEGVAARPALTLAEIEVSDQDKPIRYTTAFSSLLAVSEAGLEVSDNAHEMTAPWSSVQLIHAQMGQQAYDMTPTMRIELTVARPIFLAEGYPLWKLFVRTVEKYLPEATPAAVWTARLANDPDRGIVVYERPTPPDPTRV